MSRSKVRKGITRIPRDDKPDLSGIDMHSLVERYILLTVTMPDGLGPEKVTEGMIATLNKETRTSPPWLQMNATQAYPGDVVGLEEGK